jgi:hypothetical protein
MSGLVQPLLYLRYTLRNGERGFTTLVKILKYLVLAGGLAFLGPGWAIPIAGTSGGTFSGLSGCINCGIFDTGNGDDTQARWGGFILDLNNTSSLTAVDVVIGPTNTDADDVIIGRLDWHNESTSDFSTADRLGLTRRKSR